MVSVMTRKELPPESEMPRVYRDWLEHLRKDKKRSTLDAYGDGLRRFLFYAEIHPSLFEPSSVDQATLSDSIRLMRLDGLERSTIKSTIAAAKSFCEFCQEQGLIDGLPNFTMLRRGVPPATRLDPDPYHPGELQDLFATAREPSQRHKVRWPERDFPMLSFLAVLGLRGQELCDANCDWIRYERYVDTDEARDWTLHIQGERPRRRQLPLSWELLDAFDQWEQSRSKRFGHPSSYDPLFVTNDDERFTLERLRYWLKGLQQDAGLRHRPLKAFRQTAQLQWENSGLTASQISRFLGNSKPDWL